jgi:hypothetical protein
MQFMKAIRYIRLLTYVVGSGCVVVLWKRDHGYTEVDLVRVYPAEYSLPQQAGSWRSEWFDGANAYRQARLTPPQIIDLAERELLTTDWKAFRPRNPKIANVSLGSTEEGLVWDVQWIDDEGHRYTISVDDATSQVRHSPEVEKSSEKEWPIQ